MRDLTNNNPLSQLKKGEIFTPQPKPKYTENKQREHSDEKTKTTTKKGLKQGYTRTTFVFNEAQLKYIEALAFYLQISKTKTLSILLEQALKDLNEQQPKLLQEATKKYNDIPKKIFN